MGMARGRAAIATARIMAVGGDRRAVRRHGRFDGSGRVGALQSQREDRRRDAGAARRDERRASTRVDARRVECGGEAFGGEHRALLGVEQHVKRHAHALGDVAGAAALASLGDSPLEARRGACVDDGRRPRRRAAEGGRGERDASVRRGGVLTLSMRDALSSQREPTDSAQGQPEEGPRVRVPAPTADAAFE